MKHLKVFVILFLCTSINACKKHQPEPAREVTIQILSPVSGSEYDANDTVWLSAELRSNLDLERVNVSVNKLSNDSLIYRRSTQSNGKSLNIREYFINHLNPHADLKLTIQSSDKDGNETGKKQLNFHCHAH